MVRHFVLLVGIVLTVGLCRFAWAGPRLNYPHPQPNVCVPNVGNYGYFRTTWRQWPGEDRRAQTNPRTITSEILPTPKGQETVPLPPTPVEPQPPVELLPPSLDLEGGILPPMEPTIHDFLPEPPTEPEDEGPPGGPEEEGLPGLPGLPVESEDSVLPTPLKGGPLPEESENTGGPEPNPSSTPAPHETPGTDRPSPGAWRDTIERPTSATAALEQPDVEPEAVLARDGISWFDRHQAEAIGAAMGTSANDVEPAAYTTVESALEVDVSDKGLAVPPVALNGYCAVELVRNGRWMPGDLRWTVVHDGLIYRFSGDAQRRRFLANQDAFAPAYFGNDAVSMVDEHRSVPGQAAFCATYNGRLYMFSSAANQTRFNRAPRRYTAGK